MAKEAEWHVVCWSAGKFRYDGKLSNANLLAEQSVFPEDITRVMLEDEITLQARDSHKLTTSNCIFLTTEILAGLMFRLVDAG